jgi:hypothetical protein
MEMAGGEDRVELAFLERVSIERSLVLLVGERFNPFQCDLARKGSPFADCVLVNLSRDVMSMCEDFQSRNDTVLYCNRYGWQNLSVVGLLYIQEVLLC